MFAEKHYPEVLHPQDLDRYLARGWYRMGQTMFTTHFLCFGQQFFSAVWVRLPLSGYRFRRSLRKLHQKNANRFRTRIQRGSITREKEQLYQKYKSHFPGILAPSLRDSLLDGEDFNIFDTYEVAVYDQDQLVALSYFDRGRAAAASIQGIYDPAYRKYSLGFYTMLAEIEACQQDGLSHFYPGYVVPGYDRFDYKLRIGEVEYYDLSSGRWRPLQDWNGEAGPLMAMERKLAGLQASLNRHRIPAKKMFYPLFEANLFGFWTTTFFDYPVFLHCLTAQDEEQYVVAVYDVRQEVYKLVACTPFEEVHFYFNDSYIGNFDPEFFCMDLLVPEQLLAESADPEAIVMGLF